LDDDFDNYKMPIIQFNSIPAY